MLRAQDAAEAAGEEGAVRVTYVPEIVKEEIQAAVAADVQDVVVEDVVERARTEGWGVPGALPSWVRNIDIDTRLRVRGEGVYYDEQNAQNVYLDFNSINEDGGIGAAGPDALLNTTEDRARLRARLRVDLKAELSPTVTTRLSFATGNANDPISMNATLASYGRRLNFAVQNAAIEWAPRNDRATRGFDLYAGRFDNPFLSSTILWDEDLSFEGIASKVAFDVFRRGSDGLDPGISVLLGAFPLEEVELASDDKWLYAGQLGLEVPMGAREHVPLRQRVLPVPQHRGPAQRDRQPVERLHGAGVARPRQHALRHSQRPGPEHEPVRAGFRVRDRDPDGPVRLRSVRREPPALRGRLPREPRLRSARRRRARSASRSRLARGAVRSSSA